MATLEATKAKDTFGDTLNRVAYGKERIILTRHGRPIAALVPLDDLERLDAGDSEPASARGAPGAASTRPEIKQAIADLLALRKERAGRGLSVAEIKEMINEGRR